MFIWVSGSITAFPFRILRFDRKQRRRKYIAMRLNKHLRFSIEDIF